MINSDFHRSADSTSERTGHCPLCWTYSKSDDYCSSFEEAIASTAERPMGCPWFTSEDRANWRARHKSSDGEPSNGKQPLMASRPAPPVPSDQTFHVAQQAQGCGDPSCQDPNCDYGKQDDALRAEIRSLRIDNARLRDEAAIRALAAQPPAAPVETEIVTEFPLDAGLQNLAFPEGALSHECSSAATDEDPTASKEWNEGCDFALEQLGKYLGIDLSTITWDGATETVEGDVDAVIGNILRAKFGEDWGPDDVPAQPQEALAPDMWRCFHCNEVFTDKDAAQEHFGFWPFMPPGCVDRMRGDEKAIRKEMIDTERRFRDVCKQRDNLDAEVKQLRAQPLTLNEPQTSGVTLDELSEFIDTCWANDDCTGLARHILGTYSVSRPKQCICQDQHRRGYCTEPGCPCAMSSHQLGTENG